MVIFMRQSMMGERQSEALRVDELCTLYGHLTNENPSAQWAKRKSIR